ncbi:MAG: hypothetical protein FWG87_15035 [Defluviitaleaceae bacterium]|nr:hypothetical protein [Defluviitaleaceae bacterium]
MQNVFQKYAGRESRPLQKNLQTSGRINPSPTSPHNFHTEAQRARGTAEIRAIR